MKGIEILYWGGPTGMVGGIERYAWQTARWLREAGARVTWCGDGRPEREQALFQSGFNEVLTPSGIFARKDRYDLVALHKLPELETLVELRQRYSERLVFWAHDHDLYCPRRFYYTPFGRTNCHRAYAPLRCGLCARLVHPRNWRNLHSHHTALLKELQGHRAVVLSAFMRDNLLKNGFRPERVHLIHPVIPAAAAEAPSRPSGAPLRILFMGQLIRGKGADLLVDSLRQVKCPWKACIAGDGRDRAMLESLCSQYGLQGKVEFPGWVNDPERLLGESDVLVFPSRWQEPFGLSGAEAQAHGLPVVAFDVGGVREWLQEDETGFIVPPFDTAALAARLEALSADPARARQMGANGRAFMQQNFTPEKFLDRMRGLLTTG